MKYRVVAAFVLGLAGAAWADEVRGVFLTYRNASLSPVKHDSAEAVFLGEQIRVFEILRL